MQTFSKEAGLRQLQQAVAAIPGGEAAMHKLFAASPFIADYCLKYPQALTGHIESGGLQCDYQREDFSRSLQTVLASVDSEAALMRILRQFRQTSMVRIAWRDINNSTTVTKILTELTWLAECCLEQALQYLDSWQQEVFGVPGGVDSGRKQVLTVLGMGKLGGGELNFSSDIDLIFVYEEPGETCGGRKTVTNEQYFVQLGQKLIKVMDEMTQDGFVCRVDMRLRPFGREGRLALSFAAMEQYYQTHGRQWERYALLKARPVAGDRPAGERLLQQLRPFIYKRYLDFDMLDSLRNLKQGIARKARQKDYRNDIKLGPGGIREVEFIVQLNQLVHGGKWPALQTCSLLDGLGSTVEQGLLPASVATVLKNAYLYLRKVENRLQEYRDQQTHTLPTEENRLLLLAQSLDYPDSAAFLDELKRHRDAVKQHFLQTFEPAEPGQGSVEDTPLFVLWNSEEGELDSADIHAVLADYYADAGAASQLLMSFKASVKPALTERSRRLCKRLMPRVMEQCCKEEGDAYLALKRMLALIKAVLKRPNYLSLLVEVPAALEQTVRCCARSRWLAERLTRFPLLLDTLIDHRQWADEAGKSGLESVLHAMLQRIDTTDIEAMMECLRHFKHQQVFQVAAQSLFDDTPVTKTAARLTDIATAIVQTVLQFCWQEIADKQGIRDVPLAESGMALIAYGKMGSMELGYSSDLDIVFLYDEQQAVVDSHTYVRIIRRVTHMLSALTPSGTLYDIDLRLRPEGAAGLLISSLQAYETYQLHKAWVWEHQALVRARAVVGDAGVMKSFETIRKKVLAVKRDESVLRTEVLAMRDKMRQSLDRSTDALFDLKQGVDGIVDIEFVVQYLVLRYAYKVPELLQSTSTLVVLDLLKQCGVLQETVADTLADVFQCYRAIANAQSLQEESAVVQQDRKVEPGFRVLALIG